MNIFFDNIDTDVLSNKICNGEIEGNITWSDITWSPTDIDQIDNVIDTTLDSICHAPNYLPITVPFYWSLMKLSGSAIFWERE